MDSTQVVNVAMGYLGPREGRHRRSLLLSDEGLLPLDLPIVFGSYPLATDDR
jgi:hypothetical protein